MLFQSGITNLDGSRKIDRNRIPKLIGEGIIPDPANTPTPPVPPVANYDFRFTPLPAPRFGNILPDQGLGNGTIREPGVYGIPDPFGNILPDQGFPPPLNSIQDQMFRPPMQQPVQNQMPVANSFLEQLQQSAGLLQNQVTALQPPVVNNVPQNRFVGNQFQMPFGMGQPTPLGGNYGSGGYGGGSYTPGGYTPGQFNQYGDTSTTGGINNIINGFLGSNIRVPGGAEGRDKDQGSSVRDTHEVVNGTAYRVNRETGEVEALDGLDATIAKTLSGYFDNATIGGLLGESTYQDTLNRMKAISPEAYNEVTANVREQARVNKDFDQPDKFHFGKFIEGLFGYKPKKKTTTTTAGEGTGLAPGYGMNEQDVTRESFRGRTTPGGGNGAPGPSGNTCFVKGTMLQMADGTQKEISTVELGDNTKGGIVLMTMQALPETIYNYKDVLVSGSHWVVEDNEFVAVEDSKHGVLTDKVEPVYTLKTSDHRMWINDIEFGDFETGSDEDWEPYVEMVRKKLNKELRDGK